MNVDPPQPRLLVRERNQSKRGSQARWGSRGEMDMRGSAKEVIFPPRSIRNPLAKKGDKLR